MWEANPSNTQTCPNKEQSCLNPEILQCQNRAIICQDNLADFTDVVMTEVVTFGENKNQVESIFTATCKQSGYKFNVDGFLQDEILGEQ